MSSGGLLSVTVGAQTDVCSELPGKVVTIANSGRAGCRRGRVWPEHLQFIKCLLQPGNPAAGDLGALL